MEHMKELWNYREMIFSLVRRDLKARYRSSILGFLWMLINPLLQLCIYSIVFSVIIKMDVERFYLFLFVALVPWIFFSTCLSGGTMVIIGQKELVKKVYFPRDVLPISFTISQFVNMIISFAVIFAFVLYAGIKISWMALALLPVVMVIEFLFALGIVYLISSLTVYFRDLEHIMLILSLAWMYMTPILYPVEYVPKQFIKFFYLNPMTSITISYRDILYYGVVPAKKILLTAGLLALVVLAIGKCAFAYLQRGFAREL